jgi:hypothetical protein
LTATTVERVDKARRLLIEGRLTIHKVEVQFGIVYATCKGDSGSVYKLGYDPRGQGEWRCSCPAKTTCAHLNALKLVVVR